MLFGPLGPSLAPYVRSSRTLSKWFKPIANWYANLSGYRRVGLLYDDLRASRSSSYPPTKLRFPPHRLSMLAQAVLSAHIFI
jgi:ubiquinol-cytochrome c reductase subunit 7